MTDKFDHAERLYAKLLAAVPFAATITQNMAAAVRQASPGTVLPRQCSVIDVTYHEEDGGINCTLAFGPEEEEKDTDGVLASLTYLAFDPREPLAREIAIYQKRRLKWLRRAGKVPFHGWVRVRV